MGAYYNVLRVLGLQDDFLKLSADDEFGRKLQDLKLIGKLIMTDKTDIWV